MRTPEPPSSAGAAGAAGELTGAPGDLKDAGSPGGGASPSPPAVPGPLASTATPALLASDLTENRAAGPSKGMEATDEIGGHAISKTTPASADHPEAKGDHAEATADPDDSADHREATADHPEANADHPDLVELSAFVDGTLPADRHQLMMQHLLRCERCSDIVADTAAFLQDEPPDAALVSEPVAQPRPFERPDRLPERPPPRRWRFRPAAAYAAAALLALAVGLPLLLWRAAHAPLSTEKLAAMLAPSGGKADPWRGRVTRGQAEAAEVPPDQQSFRLGVRFLDLHLALAADDRDAVQEVCSRLSRLLDSFSLLPPEVSKQVQDLRTRAGQEPPHTLLATADALETEGFKDLVEPRYVELGRWTEACRLAGNAHRPDLFRDRATRRVLDQAVTPDAKEPTDLPPHAIDTLRTLGKAVAGGHLDPTALGQTCRGLLEELDSD